MGSSRFPGKPLAKINGKPMIQHVYNNVKKNKLASDVVVATCDKVIFDFVQSIKGVAVMTSKKHKMCMERVAEASLKKPSDIVVTIQGDEPLVTPEMIDQTISNLINNKETEYADSIYLNPIKEYIDPKTNIREKERKRREKKRKPFATIVPHGLIVPARRAAS